MKVRTYMAMVPLGIAASLAFAQGVPCVSQIVPCEGTQTVNGYGCSTGCPPYSGCCAYTQYRVNCDDGPDQFYTIRTCKPIYNCTWLVIPRNFECSPL